MICSPFPPSLCLNMGTQGAAIGAFGEMTSLRPSIRGGKRECWQRRRGTTRLPPLLLLPAHEGRTATAAADNNEGEGGRERGRDMRRTA